jgi:hypothetical protein
MSKSTIPGLFGRSSGVNNVKQKPIEEDEEEKEQEFHDYHFEKEDKQQTYDKFRNSYKKNDYIPLNHIDTVISYHFPNSTLIHHVNEDIKLINMKVADLLNAHVVNWKLNREPDEVRIPEIAKYIYQSRTRIHTLFYVNYNFKQDRFELIDGSHRYWALKMIKSLSEENGIIIDERLRNEDGQITTTWFNINENIDWLLNINIISQINFKSSENELLILRDDINSSRPMPTRPRESQPDEEKYRDINKIADDYIRRYKIWFANSNDSIYLRNIRKSNRDKFVKLVSKLYDKHNINTERIGTLKNLLDIANDKIKYLLEEDKIQCNQSIKDRCRETGFYLFLYRDDKLEKFI